MSVGESRRQGRLRIAGRDVAVQLLDESVGGLAVASDKTPACQVGDSLLLEMAGAWTEVRVAGIDCQPFVADSADAAAQTQSRLSLMRLRDVEPWEVDPQKLARPSWAGLQSMLAPLVPLVRSYRATAILMVVAVASGAVVYYVLEDAAPAVDAQRNGARASRGPTQAVSAPKIPIQKKKESARPKPGPVPRPFEARTRTTSPPEEAPTAPAVPVAASPQAAPEATFGAPHPDFLLKPEIAKLLALSRTQREQLRGLSRQLHDGADASADKLAELGRHVWDILTDKQRQSLADHQQRTTLPTGPAGNPITEPSPSRTPPASP